MITISSNGECIFCADVPNGLCFKWYDYYLRQVSDLNQACVDFTDLPRGLYKVKAYNCDCPCEDRLEADFYWHGINAGEGKTNVQV